MNLSDDTKDLIRDMLKGEPWRVFETMAQEEIKNLRILATQRTTPLEERLWYSAEAQGRENLIISFKETIHGNK